MNIFNIRHRSLLFRSYIMIVGGLIVIASALDYGLNRLQDPGHSVPGQWIDASLSLIEIQLNKLPQSDRPAAVTELERKLGFPVRLIPLDDVVRTAEPALATQQVFDASGHPAYIRTSAMLHSLIQLGPVREAAPPESALIRLIPPLFYLSIFVVVGLWLWPLVRDLNVLTESALSFAADYRRPVRTLEKVTSLRELAGSFDEMSARICHLIQRQRELTDALSHEMRTPLARIKFAIAVSGDAEKRSSELSSIRQDVEEIDALITAMLDYARLDHFEQEINLQLTPADAWLEHVVAKSRPHHRRLHVEQKATTEPVKMDPYLMELALSNLLVNACRYANTRVLVELTAHAGSFLMSVEDDGPGIPEADRKTIFKAFTRLDDSRSRETGGHGLGLAIVDRIANLHGGSARVEPSGLGGARLVVAWGADESRLMN